MKTVWSVNGAIAAQSAAHDRLETALSEKRAFEIYLGSARVTTCASLAAAKMWVGKSKRYTIIQQGA
jgi:hypothetical protein